jgi:hypothetical protein
MTPKLHVPYTSPFRSWDDKASVRTAPRRVLAANEGRLFFPPDLAPVVGHPLIHREGGQAAVSTLLTQHLYVYLWFTTKLEVQVVTEAVRHLAFGDVGDLWLPDQMRSDALRILCDEDFHAVFSADVAHQVEEATGVTPALCEPQFEHQLSQTVLALPEPLRGLGRICFAVVSETLISGKLSRIPRDERVATAIRDMVADHARDEARHHAYFSHLFKTLWPQLPAPEQRALGVLLPRFITIFLEPDQGALMTMLASLGLSEGQAAQAICETYTPSAVLQDMRRASQATVRLFRAAGVFENPAISQAFYEHNLAE